MVSRFGCTGHKSLLASLRLGGTMMDDALDVAVSFF